MTNNKKENLLDAAIKVIQKDGYEKTSVADICKEAGVAKGTFYIYFKQKSSIVPSIAEYLLAKQLNLLESKTTTVNSLETFLDVLTQTIFDFTLEHEDLILMTYAGMSLYNIFETWEEIYKPYYDYVAKKLDTFNVAVVKDASTTANYIIGLLEHAAENYVFSKTPRPDLNDAKQNITFFIKRALQGENYETSKIRK